MCVITKIRARWTVLLIVSPRTDTDYMDIRDSQASSLHSFGSCFCSECILLQQTTKNMLSATAGKSLTSSFFFFRNEMGQLSSRRCVRCDRVPEAGRSSSLHCLVDQHRSLEPDASWSHFPALASSHFLRCNFLHALSPTVFIDIALIYWVDATPRYAGPELQTWAAVFIESASTIFVYSAADLLKQQLITESAPGLNLQSSQSRSRGGFLWDHWAQKSDFHYKIYEKNNNS